MKVKTKRVPYSIFSKAFDFIKDSSFSVFLEDQEGLAPAIVSFFLGTWHRILGRTSSYCSSRLSRNSTHDLHYS